jgi:hypothetical protein
MMKVGDLLGIIEPGNYQVEVVSVDPTGKTKDGTPMVAVQYRVVDDPEWEGSTIWDNLPVTPRAAWKWIQLWVALGGSTEDEVEGLEDLVNRCVERMSGATLFVNVKRDSYNGKERAKINEYHPPEVGKALISSQKRSKEGVPF